MTQNWQIQLYRLRSLSPTPPPLSLPICLPLCLCLSLLLLGLMQSRPASNPSITEDELQLLILLPPPPTMYNLHNTGAQTQWLCTQQASTLLSYTTSPKTHFSKYLLCYVCMCPWVYVYAPYVYNTWQEQEGASDPAEVELQAAVSCPVLL